MSDQIARSLENSTPGQPCQNLREDRSKSQKSIHIVNPKTDGISFGKSNPGEFDGLPAQERPYHTYDVPFRGVQKISSASYHFNADHDFYPGPDPENYNSRSAIFRKCLVVSLGDLFNGFCWTLYNNFFDVVKKDYSWNGGSSEDFMKGAVNSFYLAGA